MELFIVFIGTLTLSTREAHINKAKKNGYEVTETISKSTTFLICGKDGDQTIINKAKSYGVRIISEQKWVETLHKVETCGTGKKRTRSDNNKSQNQKKLVYLESRQYRRFWQMRRVYKTTYIRTGSIGSKGMETSKEYETKRLAKESMTSMIASKKVSGYKEARRPQSLDYEDSSDSSDDNFGDENDENDYKYKQKKQKLENEESESDATLHGDETSDVDNGAAALKEDEDEDLSTIKSLPSLPSFITNPKSSMSIMKGNNSVDVLLAHPWKPDETDPTGWWISEKLDGVRAFWNSKRGKFYSRNGNEFVPPSWFSKGLPRDKDLDGELFGGRGKFQSTISIVKAGVEEWKNITYEIFDVPTLGLLPFEDRMKYLKKMIAENKPQYAKLVKQKSANSERDVYDELERVEKLGGEGLMIRKPGSLYEMGRSKTLLKIKTFYDGEAVVIGHEPGKGKYLRQCGSLLCRMASGKEFKVGSGMNDNDRINPPSIGSIIIYKCQELSNSGSPRFPIYLGVALDKDKPTDPDFKQKVKIK
ncbi:uncharacterized protein OCT59_008918 [Rhizophagus irregularis]|uniref:ATP-dependent DNA ligase family profile domain-containing protein n=5 Tax=Rhizophagus irregularis TaxID=588596 RepID=A0A915ZSN0_9GLOM|nr:hypothetical protein OCT59_008918 [Rhizophagus irregularis]GBC24225.1 DNA ligase/mRNA capping enzyme [Rhizophagus irregularis DAOM 181602=DAOM 197198]CAB4474904.1 unnamed protein product [Rhizophagus irregularis]CAB5386590.1 unnamed protein product [Rhizophagus irregularis]